MKSLYLRSISLCLMIFAGNLMAQEPPVSKPTKEHQWLSQFVGEWDTVAKGTMGPGQPPMECSYKVSSKTLGGFWTVNEIKGDMAGAPMNGVQTIGYDEAKKKYVGTWVDSMMPFMWQYEGSVDKSGKILTLEADGPNFTTPGKLTKFQDIYEFKSADEMAVTSKMLGEDGTWVTFLSGTAKRKR